MEYFDKNIHQEIDMRKGHVGYRKISAREIDSDTRWLHDFRVIVSNYAEFLMTYLRGPGYYRNQVFGYIETTEEMTLFFQMADERLKQIPPPKPEKAYIRSRTSRSLYYSFGHYVGVDISIALLFLLLYRQGKHKNLCLTTPNAGRSPMLAAHRYTYKYNYTITK